MPDPHDAPRTEHAYLAREDAKLAFEACPVCGAVIFIALNGKPVLDGTDRHRDWHRQALEPPG